MNTMNRDKAAKSLVLPFLLLVFLSLAAGCTGIQQRGVSADGSYTSTTRPELKVSVKDLPLVTYGSGHGSLYYTTVMGGLFVDSWVAVYAAGAEGPMAAVVHAELREGWIWSTHYPRTGSLDARTEIIDGEQFAACTYLQSAARDPFAGLAGEDVSQEKLEQEPVYWLVREMAHTYKLNEAKLVLQYREPLSRFDADGDISPAALDAFRRRALAAFSLGTPDGSPVSTGYPAGVHWRYLDDSILGPVMLLNISTL